MPKNCVITLDPAVVDKARANAHKQGKSLKEVIEDTIISTAKAKTNEEWITERELEALPWAPSRITLLQMRKENRLVVGKHYKRRGRFIFYDKAALEYELKPAEPKLLPEQLASDFEPVGPDSFGGSDY
jgi:hypothetical protein